MLAASTSAPATNHARNIGHSNGGEGGEGGSGGGEDSHAPIADARTIRRPAAPLGRAWAARNSIWA